MSQPPIPTLAAETAAAQVAAPPSLFARLTSHLPPAQMARYLAVGIFNSVFGYSTFALSLFLLNHAVPQRYLYLTVLAAAGISTPLNITVSYFGYKLFVFKTRGNYLIELIKCFGVYGVGMLPGLLALSALTRLLQSVFQTHEHLWQAFLAALALHLHGHLQGPFARFSSAKALAGYAAGALTQGFTVVFGFIGHKNVTFRQKKTA